jgi:2'-5' RNA ligase
MTRTFVAVDFPQDYVGKIAQIQSKLKDFNIKFVDPNLVHITLKFLGDVNENQIEQIAGALDGINIPSFEAKIENVGVFPKPKYVKVIWLGAEGNFGELHDNVESALKEAFLKVLYELKDIEIGTFHVDAIKLKKSTLTPEGPIYETLHEVRLSE